MWFVYRQFLCKSLSQYTLNKNDNRHFYYECIIFYVCAFLIKNTSLIKNYSIRSTVRIFL